MTGRFQSQWGPAAILGLCLLLVALRLACYAPIAGGNPIPAVCRWDCGWYASIATFGYRLQWHPSNADAHPWAFFPVLPLLLRWVRELSGLGPASCATLVASACTIACGWLGDRYRALTRPHARSSTWPFALVCVPSGFYFTTGYTEAPFAALALATLLGLARRSPYAAAWPSALLSATRATGVWLVPAILLLRRDRIAAALAARNPNALAIALLPCLIGASGLLCWMAFLAIGTGDPLAFVHAQKAWQRSSAEPFHVLATSLDAAVTGRSSWGPRIDAFAALFGLLAAYRLAIRTRVAEAILLAATVLTALASGVTFSMIRYVGASPIVLLLFADAIDRLPSRRARMLALAGSAGLQLILVAAWFRDLPVLI